MNQIPTLQPKEVIKEKPFTDPGRIVNDVNTLRFMIDQLCLFMEHHKLFDATSPPIIIHKPDRNNWFYRLFISRPKKLMYPGKLVFVGFLGQQREDADKQIADDFDKILINEIPDYPGLLCYFTMAMVSGNYTNLVVFTEESVKQEWSRSKAHQEAVRNVSPEFYESIKLYNGILPRGIMDSNSLELTRIKYYDYQVAPSWHAVRVFQDGS
jgi:hypothetical protein